MEKTLFKVKLNWQGEIHTFYRFGVSATQALRYAICQLAREVEYDARYVRNHVMSGNRYSVTIERSLND
jgi:hypothetical protein